MQSKISKACDISTKARQEVLDRDNRCCVICGSNQNIQIAHFVGRARLGLGIPQNLACMCVLCHSEYDNGKLHGEIETSFENYLIAYYPDWDKSKLTYRKWG